VRVVRTRVGDEGLAAVSRQSSGTAAGALMGDEAFIQAHWRGHAACNAHISHVMPHRATSRYSMDGRFQGYKINKKKESE
jgi:hypothetical protein